MESVLESVLYHERMAFVFSPEKPVTPAAARTETDETSATFEAAAEAEVEAAVVVLTVVVVGAT